MSDFDDYDDDFDQDAGGSNAMKDLRKANKAKEKQIKELMEQLDSLKGNVRERSVKDTIKAKGLNEKIAVLIPKDLTTSEEVESWLDEYGDIFGAAAPSTDESPSASNPSLEGLSRIANTQSTGTPFTGDQDQMAALIRAATSPEELNKLLFGTASGPSAI